LVFIAHAARALEDLTGRIEKFKNKKRINNEKVYFLKTLSLV